MLVQQREQCFRFLGVLNVTSAQGACPLCSRPGPWKTKQSIQYDPETGTEVPLSDPECLHQLQRPDGALVWVPGIRFDLYLLPELDDCNVSGHDDFCYTCGVWHGCLMEPFDLAAAAPST